MYGVKKTAGITALWTKLISKVLKIKLSLKGKLYDNDNGLIVSNHLSYIDILVHGSVFTIRFAPKSDIANWFFIGGMVDSSRPVWVNRSSKTASLKTSREFTNTLNNDINLIVYPEGTTTNGKEGILPFKSTSFEASIASGAPIIPVLIRYTDSGADNHVCWYGDMPFFSHMWNLLSLKEINAELYIMDKIYPGEFSRKELSEHVHRIMSQKWMSISGINNRVLSDFTI
jgi:1-acyl-sn-glycerol-3-phosphate acyltransferase